VAVIVPYELFERLLQWLIEPSRPGGRARAWRTLPFVLVTAALIGYGAVATGKLTGALVFLALAGATMFEAARMLLGAAVALFRDPPTEEQLVATGRRRKELEREKAALLKALKELEFDHEMRKVSDADFAEIGGVYRARAIRVLRQLDDKQLDYAKLVEEELARYRRSRPVAGAVERPATGDRQQATGNGQTASASPSAEVAPAVVEEHGAKGACPACATVNDSDAVFCKKCARRLIDAGQHA
jgi:hypothetical protein